MRHKKLIGNKHGLGYRHTPEAIEKIRQAGIGRKHSKESRLKMTEAQKGNKNNLNKHLTQETKDKIGRSNSLKQKGAKRPHMALRLTGKYGEKAPNWKGGLTLFSKRIRNHFKMRQWRSDIFSRDDYTCQLCSTRGGYLEADHVKWFSVILSENCIKTMEQAIKCEELWNLNNGRTLCRPCHKMITFKSDAQTQLLARQGIQTQPQNTPSVGGGGLQK